ncbi:MAG: hypothetical protein ACYS17_04900, partial [Planctomycetota bacterium]
ILPALIIGLWVKRPHPLAGILSMVIGTLVSVFFLFIFTSETKVLAILPALGAAIFAYILGHWIEKIRQEHK